MAPALPENRTAIFLADFTNFSRRRPQAGATSLILLEWMTRWYRTGAVSPASTRWKY
jgi:hypothetical protein